MTLGTGLLGNKQTLLRDPKLTMSQKILSLPVYLFEGYIRPVDLPGSNIHIQRHNVLQAGNNTCILATIQGHLPYLMPISEK